MKKTERITTIIRPARLCLVVSHEMMMMFDRIKSEMCFATRTQTIMYLLRLGIDKCREQEKYVDWSK
jgi:hypothetical protein